MAVMARAWADMADMARVWAWADMAVMARVMARVMAVMAKAWGGIRRRRSGRRLGAPPAAPPRVVASDRLASIWAPARPPRDVAISACRTSFPTRSTTRF